MPEPLLPVQRQAAESPRIPAFDGLRGLAALLVVIQHCTSGWVPGPLLLDRLARMVGQMGWTGVHLFFVLSGYLITGILYDSRGGPGYLRSFYARRALRILPAYYLTLVLLLVVLPASGLGDRWWGPPIEHAWAYWFFLGNAGMAAEADALRPHPLHVAWSLAIEEQFYLLWPWLVLWLSRRRLMQTCVALVLVGIAWRTTLAVLGAPNEAIIRLTPSLFDSLAIGSFIALTQRTPGGRERLLRASGWVLLVAVLLSGLVKLLRESGTFTPKLAEAAGYTPLALLFGALLIRAEAPGATGPWSALLRSRLLRTLGKYSYAIYLIHAAVRFALDRELSPLTSVPPLFGSNLPGLLASLIGVTFLSLGLAWLSWELVERRFLALKRHFRTPIRPDSLDAEPAPRVAPASI